jgi:co-chaperonin GroES (HSP10)|tara:strand:+ start:2612 stop:2866 length:255 start_codon:yes stop_codon:yes gene_type:complete
MQAVNLYIVVEKIKQAPTKIGGLELTDDLTDNRYDKGKIISVGNLVQGVKDNDTIYYDKHAGNTIQKDKKSYQIITVKDVVLID